MTKRVLKDDLDDPVEALLVIWTIAEKRNKKYPERRQRLFDMPSGFRRRGSPTLDRCVRLSQPANQVTYLEANSETADYSFVPRLDTNLL